MIAACAYMSSLLARSLGRGSGWLIGLAGRWSDTVLNLPHDLADWHGLALGDGDGQGAAGWRGNLVGRLFRFQFEKRLVGFYGIAVLFQPATDGSFPDRFTH